MIFLNYDKSVVNITFSESSGLEEQRNSLVFIPFHNEISNNNTEIDEPMVRQKFANKNDHEIVSKCYVDMRNAKFSSTVKLWYVQEKIHHSQEYQK